MKVSVYSHFFVLAGSALAAIVAAAVTHELSTVPLPASQCVTRSPVAPKSVGDWLIQHQLHNWRLDWNTELGRVSERAATPAQVLRDLSFAKFGRMRGQRAVVLVPRCNCSSIGTQAYVFSEEGARLHLHAGDTITLEFVNGQLHIAYHDDDEAANCCPRFWRHTYWDLAGVSFVEMNSERLERAVAL